MICLLQYTEALSTQIETAEDAKKRISMLKLRKVSTFFGTNFYILVMKMLRDDVIIKHIDERQRLTMLHVGGHKYGE